MMVCVVFFILAITIRSNLTNSIASANPEPSGSVVPPSPTFTPGLAIIPPNTFTPLPADDQPDAEFPPVWLDGEFHLGR